MQELALFTAGGRRKFLAGVWNLGESEALVLIQGAATSVGALRAWSQDRGGQKERRPSWPNLAFQQLPSFPHYKEHLMNGFHIVKISP